VGGALSADGLLPGGAAPAQSCQPVSQDYEGVCILLTTKNNEKINKKYFINLKMLKNYIYLIKINLN
jgi:hypothetical protein